ncbi:response regulator [Oceanicoccus sagamiensis]|uniref:histidine kinase n=1 Tax=Oceanicoccus sagamiensis TaxID=716816 RepID=A0A1X9NJS0_9GAMM|nr:response regulator [Oceanicoccus sagamiensis]ARN76085.1 hypothetical protein BST96_19480 [Oceanicoccus sagamiensis]
MTDDSDDPSLRRELERLKAENQRLRHQVSYERQGFETFMENSPMTAFYKDADGRLLYINSTFIEAFGFEHRDWQGKTDFELWDEETATVLRENDCRILESGQLEAVEEQVQRPHGVEHWMTHKFCFVDSEGNKYLGGMGVNITQQKVNDQLLRQAKERAEQSSKEKSEFLSLVSHELRTPLHSILSSSELWSDQESVFDQNELLGYVSLGAARLRSQVDNLVLLAETDSKELVAGQFEFEIVPLIERISSCVTGLVNQGVDYSIHYDKSLPDRYCGDPYLLEHMVRVVLENACKYTDQGFVRLTIEWDQQRERLEFTITDSGHGMSREQQTKIYNHVVVISRGLNRESEGMGLGLTVCYRLSELLDADLIINSHPGKGTEIVLGVPLSVAGQQAPSNQKTKSASSHVLVVEDNSVNAKVLGKIICKFGAEFTIVNSGNEALLLLENKVFDLILMDLQMPIMDGVTTTRWIRQRGINTPIVAVTCNSELAIRQRCMQNGMNDFLVKPVRQQDILRVFERQNIL